MLLGIGLSPSSQKCKSCNAAHSISEIDIWGLRNVLTTLYSVQAAGTGYDIFDLARTAVGTAGLAAARLGTSSRHRRIGWRVLRVVTGSTAHLRAFEMTSNGKPSLL
eukprot:137187-Pleurochrysis_carterae.AAC.1